ncbi:MAG: MFS transporter [Fusobacteriaceae bacterium]
MINTSTWKKNTILFLSSQAVSLIGTSLVQYAIIWHITLKTKSATLMTIAMIFGFVPTFILSPFAGVWADRHNRKYLIAFSDSGIAFATLILAIFFLKGYGSIWLLFIVSAVRSAGSAIQTPAVGAFLPQIVPKEYLIKVNGINGSIQSALMLFSPMLSGILMTLSPIEYIFFIDVFTALIAVFIVLKYLKVPSHAKAMEKQKVTYFHDLKLGFDYIRNHSYIKVFFIFQAIIFFCLAPVMILTPLQVVRIFGDQVWRLTIMEVIFSVGMIFGGIIISAWGGLKNKFNTLLLTCISFGIFTMMLGLMKKFYVYLAFMLLIGIGVPISNTVSTVIIQEKVEPDILGRVFSIFALIFSSVIPLSMIFFGPLADKISVSYIIFGSGILVSCITIIYKLKFFKYFQ